MNHPRPEFHIKQDPALELPLELALELALEQTYNKITHVKNARRRRRRAFFNFFDIKCFLFVFFLLYFLFGIWYFLFYFLTVNRLSFNYLGFTFSRQAPLASEMVLDSAL